MSVHPTTNFWYANSEQISNKSTQFTRNIISLSFLLLHKFKTPTCCYVDIREFRAQKWENQLWRIKTNNELNKLIKHQNIVNYIKALRLSWFGHVQSMPDFRTAKKIFKWTPLTTRPKGRPKQRWEDTVIQDIRLLNIKNWTPCVQDRVKWKTSLRRPKFSKEKVKRLMKKKKRPIRVYIFHIISKRYDFLEQRWWI